MQRCREARKVVWDRERRGTGRKRKKRDIDRRERRTERRAERRAERVWRFGDPTWDELLVGEGKGGEGKAEKERKYNMNV